MFLPDLGDLQPAGTDGSARLQHQLRAVLNQEVFHINIGQIRLQGDRTGGVIRCGGRKDQVTHTPAFCRFVCQIGGQRRLVTVEHPERIGPVAVLVCLVVHGIGKHATLGVERYGHFALQVGMGKAHGAVQEGDLCSVSHPQISTLHHQDTGPLGHRHFIQRERSADIEILVLRGSNVVAKGVLQLCLGLHHQLQAAGGMQRHSLAQRQLVGVIHIFVNAKTDGVVGFQILRQGHVGVDHQQLLDAVFSAVDQVIHGVHIARQAADLYVQCAAVVPFVLIGPPAAFFVHPTVFPQQLAFAVLGAGDGHGVGFVFLLILDADQAHIIPEPLGAVGITDPLAGLIIIEHKVEHTGSGPVLGQSQMIGSQLGRIGNLTEVSILIQNDAFLVQPDGHILTIDMEPGLLDPVFFHDVSDLNGEMGTGLHQIGVDGHGIQAGFFVPITHPNITICVLLAVIMHNPFHILHRQILIHMAHPDRQILTAVRIPWGIGQPIDVIFVADLVVGIETKAGQFHIDWHGQLIAVWRLPADTVFLPPLQSGQLHKGPVVVFASGGPVGDVPQLHAADLRNHRLIMPRIFIKILGEEDQTGLLQRRRPDLGLGIFRFAPQRAILVRIPLHQPVCLQMGIAGGQIGPSEIQIGAGIVADIAPNEGLTGDGDGGVGLEFQQNTIGVFGVPIAEQGQLVNGQIHAFGKDKLGFTHQINAFGDPLTQKQGSGVIIGIVHQGQDIVITHGTDGQLAHDPVGMLVQHRLDQIHIAAKPAHSFSSVGVFQRHQTIILTDARLEITGIRSEKDGIADFHQHVIVQIQTNVVEDTQQFARIQRDIIVNRDVDLGEHHQNGCVCHDVFR